MATEGSLGSHLLFPLLHAERFLFSTFSHATKEIADICMQAWRMSLTKTVCQTLSLMLINGLTLLCTIDIIGTNVVKFGTFLH